MTPTRRSLLLFLVLWLTTALAACSEPPEAEATRPPRATATPRPRPASTAPNGRQWLVMLYEDADDEILEQDMLNDLNEAELVGSDENITIVAQMDRYDGGYDGDGDWTGTKRFLVEQDDDLEELNSTELDDLGEVNMADGDTLVDFVTWAAETYPAEHYALIMSDHGAGWPGGWNDPDPPTNGPDDLPMAESSGDMLFLMEIESALARITDTTSIRQFELLGFDACLMSSLEVYTAIAPYARYAVASEEVEPSLGWAYAAFLGDLAAQPESDGAVLANSIVRSYIKEDEQIVDDQARARYVERTYEDSEDMTARQLVREETQRTTLSSVDLSQIPGILSALDELVLAMAQSDPKPITAARRYALAFETVFDSDLPKPTIDLGNFAQLVAKKAEDPAISSASEKLIAALGQAVMENSFGHKLKGATGMTIHFPNAKLYKDAEAGPDSYTTIASAFASASLWDDFLAFRYDDIPLPEADANQLVHAEEPAQALELTEIELSSDIFTSGETIEAYTTISGENLAFVYVFIGQIDPETQAMHMIDMDYIAAEETREVDGVPYPDWGEGDVEIGFEWDGTLYAINDGSGDPTVALIQPESYGSDTEDATYTTAGIYTSAKTGNSRHALLRFSAGELVDVYGYTGDEGTGAMREITPKKGDTIELEEQWVALDPSAEDSGFTTQGETMTFGRRPMAWESVDAPAGEYVLGFIAEDSEGNWSTASTIVNFE